MSAARLLVVDDDAVTCRLLAEVLSRDGATVVWETDPRRALARAAEQPIDLAVLDVRMPELDGLELLRRLRERWPQVPVVIMTAFGSIDTAVLAIASGAVDYVSKPMDVEELRATVRRALGRRTETQAELPEAGEEFGGVVGRTPAMVEVYKTIARVAPGPSTVLVTGESGTGKELVARAIHSASPRTDRPFIAVNCGAIPAELLESEMFGHERGAFTGAIAQRSGMFQLAAGGTIFLDEVGEMSPVLQVKLLRVLQDREVRPVGADRPLKVDVRVVAASNKDLAQETEHGRFREDLFYRLQVIPIVMPALRERRSDIPLLIRHFLEKHNRKRAGRPARLSEEAMVHLWEHDWPGNVRELENLLERLVILSEDGMIEVEHLPSNIRSLISEKKIPRPTLGEDGLDLNTAVEEFENRLIEEALRRTKGNKQAAARLLGLKRTTLVAKLRRRRGPDEAGDEVQEDAGE